jgi:hypothetical protein
MTADPFFRRILQACFFETTMTELAAAWKTAVHAVDKPLLSIRGISDVVGFNRSTAWTEYACQTAAAFARALIGSGLIETRNDTPPG